MKATAMLKIRHISDGINGVIPLILSKKGVDESKNAAR